jgi:hypothetical protein
MAKKTSIKFLLIAVVASSLCSVALSSRADDSLPTVNAVSDPELVAAIFEAAHDSANQIKDIDARVNSLMNVADAHIRAGDTEGARKVLANARSVAQTPEGMSTIYYFTFSALARHFMQVGDADAALALRKIAQKKQSNPPPVNKDVKVSKMNAAEMSAAEVQVFMNAKYSSEGQRAILADQQSAHHDFAAAAATLKSMKDGMAKDGALTQLARNQAVAGDFKSAFATAKTVSDPGQRVFALLWVLPLPEVVKQNNKLMNMH